MKMNNIQVLSRLVGLIKPLLGYMIVAIFMGVLGFLAAISIPVLGAYGILEVIAHRPWTSILALMIVSAVLRGILRYAEQASNHFIAFKLLARIRDLVFGKLRELAPAKLEVKEKGNLIALITSDVELLEVFYAHTISPICIAFIVSIFCIGWQSSMDWRFGMLAFVAYGSVGILLPYFLSKHASKAGRAYRDKAAAQNAFILESVRGLRELIQFGNADRRERAIMDKTRQLAKEEKKIKQATGLGSSISNLLVVSFSFAQFLLAYILYQKGIVDLSALLIAPILQISSFCPVLALANLGTGLAQTLGAGERVLALLDEKPLIQEKTEGKEVDFEQIKIENISFDYDGEQVLEDISYSIPKNKILGIHGESGCGKSTLLKLLMRFWDVEEGQILIDGVPIQQLKTKNLRDHECLVEQETYLFHDSIEKNIKLVKEDATHEEVVEACKKANIHDLIESLPHGYETKVAELGSSLSGGEKQRIGLARAFLYGADLMLLDEPTSNLDSLNEALILKAIDESKDGKTILLVSHRESTLQFCDQILQMENV